MRLLFLVSLAAPLVAAGAVPWPWHGYETFPALFFGANETGPDSPQQLALDSRFSLAGYGWQHESQVSVLHPFLLSFAYSSYLCVLFLIFFLHPFLLSFAYLSYMCVLFLFSFFIRSYRRSHTHSYICSFLSFFKKKKVSGGRHAEAILFAAAQRLRQYQREHNATMAPIFVYRQSLAPLSLFDVDRAAYADPSLDGLWLHQPNGSKCPVWNFASDAAVEYYLQHVIARVAAEHAAVSAVFLDDFDALYCGSQVICGVNYTRDAVAAMYNGKLHLAVAAARLLKARNMTLLANWRNKFVSSFAPSPAPGSKKENKRKSRKKKKTEVKREREKQRKKKKEEDRRRRRPQLRENEKNRWDTMSLTLSLSLFVSSSASSVFLGQGFKGHCALQQKDVLAYLKDSGTSVMIFHEMEMESGFTTPDEDATAIANYLSETQVQSQPFFFSVYVCRSVLPVCFSRISICPWHCLSLSVFVTPPHTLSLFIFFFFFFFFLFFFERR